MIIQNFDIVSIPIIAGQTKFFPKYRVFVDKLISNIIAFSQADNIVNDMSGNTIVELDNIKYLFLSLFNSEKKPIFLNLNCLNILSDSNVILPILDNVNFDLSKMETKKNNVTTGEEVIEFGFVYRTDILSELKPTNNAYTIDVKMSDKKIYKLSDFGGWFLKKKQIKRITTKGYKGGYLTLRDTGGKVCNRMPLNLLSENMNTENLMFDNYVLDIENSYIEIPFEAEQNGETTFLTFYF